MRSEGRPHQHRRYDIQNNGHREIDCIDDVYGKIDDVVSDDNGSMEPIVQRKGKGPIDRGGVMIYDIRECLYVPHKEYLRDAVGIIKLEWHMKAIGICKKVKDRY